MCCDVEEGWCVPLDEKNPEHSFEGSGASNARPLSAARLKGSSTWMAFAPVQGSAVASIAPSLSDEKSQSESEERSRPKRFRLSDESLLLGEVPALDMDIAEGEAAVRRSLTATVKGSWHCLICEVNFVGTECRRAYNAILLDLLAERELVTILELKWTLRGELKAGLQSIRTGNPRPMMRVGIDDERLCYRHQIVFGLQE